VTDTGIRRLELRLLLIIAVMLLAACEGDVSPGEGERLAYALGCVNCHHQTPKDLVDAPPLVTTKKYSLEEFSTFLRTGRTSSGRDLLEIGSIMGIIAVEQYSYLTDDEVRAVYAFLHDVWTDERAYAEEARIAELYKPILEYEDPGVAPSD